MARKKILIVEDDNFTRFMMQRIIRTLDVALEVDIAEDGESGCAQLEMDPASYGLVLMDIHMPGMSGVEATKRIRASGMDPPSNIPIFAVTADMQYHRDDAMKEHGMSGYFSKPISPGELISLIDEYCS